MYRYFAIGILLLVALLGLSASNSPSSFAQDETPLPPPTGHPNLFFSAEDLPTLQEQAQTTHQALWLPLEAYVESQLGSAPPALAPDGIDYRDLGNEIIPLAFSCVISERDDFCELAKTYLLTYAQWTKWNDTEERDLGLAHMLIGNSIAYDWLYSRLTEAERDLVQAALVRWGFRMYEASVTNYQPDWNNWWVSSYLQNHHWTNHSALGIVTLTLLLDEESFTTNQTVIECVVTTIDRSRLRREPNTEAEIASSIEAEQPLTVNAYVDLEEFRWWYTTEDAWIRSDLVREDDLCEQVPPIVEVNLAEMEDRARRSMLIVRDTLNNIKDGSWHEGLHYQRYGLTTYLLYMLSSRRYNPEVNLFPVVYLKNYSFWRVYNHMPASFEPILAYGNFESWWGNTYYSQNLLRFVAKEYQDPQAQWLADEITNAGGNTINESSASWAVFEFLNYDPEIRPASPSSFTGACVFTDLEGVIWRTGWEQDDLIFGLKTGAYGGRFAYDTFLELIYPWYPSCPETGCTLNVGHDHADANTFFLSRGSQWLVPEHEGFNLYPTDFHNTLLIDGQGQYRPTDYLHPEAFEDSDGFLELTLNTNSVNYIAADATRRYHDIEGLRDFTRHVLFVQPNYFVMIDNLEAVSAHNYEWVAHFEASAALEDNWIRGNTNGNQILGINVVSPSNFEVNFGDSGRPYVRIQPTETIDNMRFINVLYPTAVENWDRKPIIRLVEDNGEIAFINIAAQDSNTIDDVIIAYGSSDEDLIIGDYFFDGQLVVYSRTANNIPKRLFVYGGTTLTYQGLPLLTDADPTQPIEVVYDRENVAVYGNVEQRMVLYAPDIENLTLNGFEWDFVRAGAYIAFGGESFAYGSTAQYACDLHNK